MDEDLSLSSGTTLYVKNLSFVTTQERFTQVFRHLPSFSFARIQTKPDPQNLDGPRLRMGYGFIVFKDKTSRRRSRVYKGSFWMVIPYTSSLQVVLQKKTHHPKIRTVWIPRVGLQSSLLRMCRSKLQRKISVISLGMYHIVSFSFRSKPVNWLKKSVPCNSAHGHLKSVRLPKNFDARTRGFAFLESASRHEAESANNTLQHTHLLGRHLVLEWAEEAEQDLSVLR